MNIKHVLLALAITTTTACGAPVDVAKAVQAEVVTSGWLPASSPDGKNKIVPSVSVALKNVSDQKLTALQVNAGREKEETTAYIAAYARGGKSVGEFTSADQAINKAFELCPKT